MGSRPRWTDFHKNGVVVGVDDVISFGPILVSLFLGVSDLQGVKISIFHLTVIQHDIDNGDVIMINRCIQYNVRNINVKIVNTICYEAC